MEKAEHVRSSDSHAEVFADAEKPLARWLFVVGVVGLTRPIGANALLPGRIRSDMTGALQADGTFEDKRIVLKLTLDTPVAYDWNEDVRTAELSFPFKVLKAVGEQNGEMAVLSVNANSSLDDAPRTMRTAAWTGA